MQDLHKPKSELNMLSNPSINTYRTSSLPIQIANDILSTKTDKILSHVLQLFQNINSKPNAKMKYYNTLENTSLSKENCNFIVEKECIVYRCQLSSKKEVCCCSCNSDAMFEVMKSLYDCYKKKNCDNCKCVLCGRLPKEARKYKDIEKKSQGDGVAVSTDKKIKPSKPKQPLTKEDYTKEKTRTTDLITPSTGDAKPKSAKKSYTPVEVEKVKKNARDLGLMTPSIGETASEKKKIQKTRASKAPSADKERVKKEASSVGITIRKKKSEAYKIKPKEQVPAKTAKTKSSDQYSAPIKPKDMISRPPAEKEQISNEARLLGLTTPSQGDTASEKNKIRSQRAKKASVEQQKNLRHRALTAGIIKPDPEVKQIMEKEAREAGLKTPSVGKTPSVKEKIRRSRAAKFTDKEREEIRKAAIAVEVVKPPKTTPITPIEQENILKEARLAGIITPSEGDTKSQKEKIRKSRSKKKPLEQKEKIRKQLQVEDIIAPKEIKSDKIIKPDEIIKPDKKEKKEKKDKKGKLDKKTKPEKKKKEKKVKSSKSMNVECICSEVMKSRKKEITEVDRIRHSMQMAKALSYTQKKPSVTQSPSSKAPSPLGKALSAPFKKPSVTKTPSKKDKARDAKRLSEKERIRQTLQSAGIIAQIEKTTPAEREKIKKMARDVGILTPSIGNSPSEKERIQKTRAKKHSVPEKEKVRQQAQAAGVIPIKKSPSQEKKDVLKQIRKAGLATPSEGNTPSVKENIRQSRVRNSSKTKNTKLLKKAQDLGVKVADKPLTSNEKKKIQQEGRTAGLLTPSIGNTPSEKKIIRETRAKTVSSADKEQVRKKLQKSDIDELVSKKKSKQKKPKKPKEKKLSECECKISLTKPAKKQKQKQKGKSKEAIMQEARKAGLLTPSTGKTDSEKEEIQKTRAATVKKSEKKRIQKSLQDIGIQDIKKERTQGEKLQKGSSTSLPRRPLSLRRKKKPSKKDIPTSQTDKEEQKLIIKEARNAGLLTPSIGKNESEKEEIRKSRSAKVKPTEKKRIEKALNEIGIRETKKEPKDREEEKAILKEARDAGLLTPSIGKNESEKEEIRKSRSAKVKPTEKKRIEKTLKDLGIRETKKQPKAREEEKAILKEARDAGLLTPSIGKNESEKEEIRKSRSAKVKPTEKKRIEKTLKDLGIRETKKQPKAREEEKSIIKEARDAGLLTPSIGKNQSEKEEIRKSRSAKVKPSEKKRLEKALKDIGVREIKKEEPTMKASRHREKPQKSSSISLPRRSLSLKRRKKHSKKEIMEQTTKKTFDGKAKKTKGLPKMTCDRGCGCDSKKIKFKHSYVKIKVTSPDISSLCPCPDDCLPSIKQADNNGIKVTVGTVLIVNDNTLNNNYFNENKYMESNSIKTLYFNESLLKMDSSYSNISSEVTKESDTLVNYISNEKFKQNFISQYVIQQSSLSRRYGIIRSYYTNMKSQHTETNLNYNSEVLYNGNLNSTTFSFDTSNTCSNISSSVTCSSFTEQVSEDLTISEDLTLSDINYGSQELFEDNSSIYSQTQLSESNSKIDVLDAYKNIKDCLLKKYVRQIIYPYILHKIKNCYKLSNGSDTEEQSAIFIVMPENEGSNEDIISCKQRITNNINTNITYEKQYTQYLAKTTKNVHITGIDKEGRLIYHTIATDTAERPCSCLEPKLSNDNENNVRKLKKNTCQQCTKSQDMVTPLNKNNTYNLSKENFNNEHNKIDLCKCLPNFINIKDHYDNISDATDNIYIQYEDDSDINKDLFETSNNIDSRENIFDENLNIDTADSQDKVNGIKLTISGKGATARGFRDIPCIEKLCFNKNKGQTCSNIESDTADENTYDIDEKSTDPSLFLEQCTEIQQEEEEENEDKEIIVKVELENYLT